MQQDKKKLYLIIGGVVACAAIIIGIFLATRGQKDGPVEPVAQESAAPRKKRLSAPVNVIALEKRPVVHLRPFSQNGGRFVSIELQQLRQEASSAEYENVYNIVGASAVSASGVKVKMPDNEPQTGLDAFVGELDITSLPTKTENRFGTCSAGGACTNQSVDYGTLMITFGGDEAYAVAGDWTYFEEGIKSSQTHDEAFSIASDALAASQDYLILQSLGLPDGVPQGVVTVPDDGKDKGTRPVSYQLHLSQPPSAGAVATVSFKSAGEKVAVYDGQSWTTYDLGDELPLGNNYVYTLLAAIPE